MCTLTYIPDGQAGFVLTTNRDESPARPTLPPRVQDLGTLRLLYPKDGLAGGTWVGTTSAGRTVCLLNGAFQRHEMGTHFRGSRGVVLLDLMRSDEGVADFLGGYDLEGIEPFTVVEVWPEVAGWSLQELRWDGQERHVRAFASDEAHIWSSAQLYKPEVIQQREVWFAEWLETYQGAARVDAIQSFHRFGGQGDVYNDLRMNRGMVRTVSTTRIRAFQSHVEMQYEDLVNTQTFVEHLDWDLEE